MLSHEFIRLALLAGTPIALACGLVGYFVVLRSQVFAGDALSHVAFTGALAAAAAGVDARAGLFVATVALAGAIGALGGRAHADDVVIGTVFAWILGLGALFLSIFSANRSGGGNGVGGVRVLFGSIFGLSPGQAWLAAAIAAGVIAALLVIVRPLLFASLDAAVAEARGIPVRALGIGFLCLIGLTAAEATQAVGALLLVGLLAAPAGAAYQLEVNPYRGMALSGALSVAALWLGLVIAYVLPSVPPSSAIIGVAACVYVLATLWAWGSRRTRPVLDAGA
jgi:zinc/manganese transport system permease protein